MKHKKLRILIPALGIVALLLSAAFYPQFSGSRNSAQAHGLNFNNLSKLQKKILSGIASYELNPATATPATPARPKNYFPTTDDGCTKSIGSNIKVNQNCLNLSDTDLQGRAQAQNETSMAQDPMHPNRIVASYNDYRRGDGNCYGAYSSDGGHNWTDTTIPMSFTRGTAFGSARQYWQAGGDTEVAWDTKGNVYFQCQVFERGFPVSSSPDLSSAVYIFRSTKNGGASWNFPGRPVIESADVQGTGVAPFEDKPFFTVDNHVGSPYQDRIYVTYTEFASNGTAKIYESYSSDYGEHFSPRVLVSTTSTLCPNVVPGDPANSCDANQFSQPFTGQDGALYVAYSNFNNAEASANDNHYQVLLSKSTDGGQSFGAPVKVADYNDLPDCAAYQGGHDAGRSCVPEKGPTTNSFFRAANYPVGAVNPTNVHQVIVTIGSYINMNSNEKNGCVPAGFSPYGNPLYTGVKTPGACNNDILESVSNNAGATFTGTTTDPRQLTSVTNNGNQKKTDQWFQWAVFTTSGRLAVSYYDRQYGSDETTGFSDFSLSGSNDMTEFNVARATTSASPPPTQFSGVFWGDYTGLSVSSNSDAHPLWSDTRDVDLFVCPGVATGSPPKICRGSATNAAVANDQDAYTQTMPVP